MFCVNYTHQLLFTLNLMLSQIITLPTDVVCPFQKILFLASQILSRVTKIQANSLFAEFSFFNQSMQNLATHWLIVIEDLSSKPNCTNKRAVHEDVLHGFLSWMTKDTINVHIQMVSPQGVYSRNGPVDKFPYKH